MNRVSVVILVVVLVALGLWAATRDRSGDATAAAEPVRAEASLDATESPPASTDPDDAVMDDVADATGSAPASAPRSAPAPFEPVAFLTEAPQQQFDAAEEVLDPDLDYRAVIETDVGTVTVDLFESRAPRTVNNFVFLALHRFYEGVPFHRVIDDFMAQTGDPTGTGRGGPGYAFDDEIDDALVHDRPGLLSMANAGPNTNGSQFFLTMAATPWLDGRHAIFGEIVDGLDVLDALTRVDPQNPSVVAALSDPASRLADQGVSEAANVQGTVEDFLGSELGELPSPGQTFRVVGRRGVFGSADGVPAVGLFPVPDRIERVTITARAKEDQP